jgi:hypothetical protein
MDTQNMSAEELRLEQEQINSAKQGEDEIRDNIISEFGFDEATDTEKIDKLVAKEVDHRKKLSKAIGQKVKLRDELAKGKQTETKPTEPAPAPQFSFKDQRALLTVHEDDIDEVIEYATLKKITITEALKTSTVKAILSEKEKERKVSEATNTGGGKRTVTKPSPEKILDEASKGKFPEKGSPEAEALFWARRKK